MTDKDAATEAVANAAPTEAKKEENRADAAKAVGAVREAGGTEGGETNATGAAGDESGLFGWGGLTEGIGQLWGSVSREGEGEGGEPKRDAPKPALSPSLAPLTKAATEMAASATTELGNAGKVAQLRLGEAAKEVERGWGAFNSFLDDILTPQTQGEGAETQAERGAVAIDGAAEKLHERFPTLDRAEEAVEVYECAMMQKYRSVLNGATPEKTFACNGILYVTPSHLAMYVLDDGGAFGAPFGTVIPLADVKRVQRGNKNMLRVLMVDQSSFVFAAFASVDTFKAAVDVLHHLVGADEGKKPKPAPSGAQSADASEANEVKESSS